MNLLYHEMSAFANYHMLGFPECVLKSRQVLAILGGLGDLLGSCDDILRSGGPADIRHHGAPGLLP